jgi:Methyltransferase domain
VSLKVRLAEARFRRRWGFQPPPVWSDWVGYELLLEEAERNGIAQLDGDVLEIGAFLGGGTAKLCDWFARNAPGKRVVTVDIFDPEFDPTTTVEGWTMGELYASALQGRGQREVFDEVTAARQNLLVVPGDSTSVELPVEQLALAFVDGSHVPADVRSDFELVWDRLVSGGIAAFHDYGGDLPGVTHTLHERIGKHADEIARVWTRSPLLLFAQRG